MGLKKSTPIVFTQERTGRGSAADAWAVLSDFGSLARWTDAVSHSSMLTAQHEGVGTSRRVQAGRNALIETVVTWQPPGPGSSGDLAYAIQGLPKALGSVVNSWTLIDVIPPTDAVRIRLSFTIDPVGPAARFLPRPLLRAAINKTLNSLIDGLCARLLERSGAIESGSDATNGHDNDRT